MDLKSAAKACPQALTDYLNAARGALSTTAVPDCRFAQSTPTTDGDFQTCQGVYAVCKGEMCVPGNVARYFGTAKKVKRLCPSALAFPPGWAGEFCSPCAKHLFLTLSTENSGVYQGAANPMWCPNWRQCTDEDRAAYCIPSNVYYGAVRGRSAPCMFCQQPAPLIHLQWQTSQITSPEETLELRQDVRWLILTEERHPQVHRLVTHQGFDAQRFVAICALDAQNLYGLCYCRSCMQDLARRDPSHPELTQAAVGPHMLLIDQVPPADRYPQGPHSDFPPPLPVILSEGDANCLRGNMGPFHIVLERVPERILIIEGLGERIELRPDYDTGLMGQWSTLGLTVVAISVRVLDCKSTTWCPPVLAQRPLRPRSSADGSRPRPGPPLPGDPPLPPGGAPATDSASSPGTATPGTGPADRPSRPAHRLGNLPCLPPEAPRPGSEPRLRGAMCLLCHHWLHARPLRFADHQ